MHGYLGYSTVPYNISNSPLYSPSSIYAFSDTNEKELFIIPLTIGCFREIYSFIHAKAILGFKVRILPLSINYDYFSDIYNIVTAFSNKGVDIKWMFPKRPKNYTSEQFELLQIHDNFYVGEEDSSILVAYTESGVEDLYDIVIRTNEFTKVFSLFVTQEKLDTYLKDKYELNMCAEMSRHGGLCAMDIDSTETEIQLFNFLSENCYYYLRTKFKVGYEYESW